MSTGTTFDSTKRDLQGLLKDIASGKTQLPDFQRGWVWDDKHIVSLLASISLSYPIGAIMLMETGGEGVRFKPRPIEGAPENVASVNPEYLILDGQQRLTSLFQALMAKGAVATRDTRGAAIKRWYYIDIAKALTTDTDREDAILGLPEDRIVRDFRGNAMLDVSTPEKEYEKGLFPLSKIFDCNEWRRGHSKFWNHAAGRAEQFDQFDERVIERFKQYLLPVITLLKQTPKEAVCQVFEKVNTGGVSLTVFELLTATFAADDFNLRDDWAARRHAVKAKRLLHVVREDDFLQTITLLGWSWNPGDEGSRPCQTPSNRPAAALLTRESPAGTPLATRIRRFEPVPLGDHSRHRRCQPAGCVNPSPESSKRVCHGGANPIPTVRLAPPRWETNRERGRVAVRLARHEPSSPRSAFLAWKRPLQATACPKTTDRREVLSAAVSVNPCVGLVSLGSLELRIHNPHEPLLSRQIRLFA